MKDLPLDRTLWWWWWWWWCIHIITMVLGLKLRNTAYWTISDFSYSENKIVLVSKNTYERGTLNQLVKCDIMAETYTTSIILLILTYKSRNYALWSWSRDLSRHIEVVVTRFITRHKSRDHEINPFLKSLILKIHGNNLQCEMKITVSLIPIKITYYCTWLENCIYVPWWK